MKNDIEDKKALVTNGYYRFVVTGFNSSDLDSIEKELSGDGSEYMVACQKEFVVKYPLQCSCLENPRDGGAWWVPVYGVAQSRTRLT